MSLAAPLTTLTLTDNGRCATKSVGHGAYSKQGESARRKEETVVTLPQIMIHDRFPNQASWTTP